jgi:DNA-binding transcriptional LysR family regulator
MNTRASGPIRGARDRGAVDTPSRPATQRSSAAESAKLASLKSRNDNYITPSKLEAFVAVAEEGGFTAAARRLHMSQPSLSQTVSALERQFGVELFARSATGVEMTEAGRALLGEAKATLARHEQLLRTVAGFSDERCGVIRIGIPLELAPDVLRALAKFATDNPETRVKPHHMPVPEQLAALRGGRLDLSFLREHPGGSDLDTMLVAREYLGVLLAEDVAARIARPQGGIDLSDLSGLSWAGFERSDSPAWYDELASILRSHGIDVQQDTSAEHLSVPSVMFTEVSAGHAFALAPPLWAHPIPDTVVWTPLIGHPVARRTWAVWPADSRKREVAKLITVFESPE